MCGVEEARLTGDLIRLLFGVMEVDQSIGDRVSGLDFDAKLALATAARNAQWLTRIRNDNFLLREKSILSIFRLLIR